MSFGLATSLLLVLTALAAAFAGIGTLALLSILKRPAAAARRADAPLGTVFMFDGETMIDATPAARALLAAAPLRGSAWQRFMSVLGPRFPGLDRSIADLPSRGRIVMESPPTNNQASLSLLAEWRGGVARISVSGPEGDGRHAIVDPLTERATLDELAMLREVLSKLPCPVWVERDGSGIVWGNKEYFTRLLRGDVDLSAVWPLPPLGKGPIAEGQRLRLDPPQGDGEWIEAKVRPIPGGKCVFGLPATELVQAEDSLRDFTQTLTKTFAHLPIGLAIFDQNRQLTLFNPALPDLTSLPVGFLAGRPTLFDMLDRMRELRMIPEPENYPDWRRRMAVIEQEAATGVYDEIWHLPGAQTFRVLGRPHPNGALALMIEDITKETARTRRYRADVELGQSVLDEMDEAIAVFSPAGLLVLSNAAYSQLWKHDPSSFVTAESSIFAIAAHWRTMSAPSPIWSEAERFVAVGDGPKPQHGDARLNDGRLVACRFVRLHGGLTMIAFRPAAPRSRKAAVEKTARAKQRA